MDAPQQAARSGGGAVTVTVLLKVAKMMLDVPKLLDQAVQLVYGGEMAAARGESGVEMGWGVFGGRGVGEEGPFWRKIDLNRSLRARPARL